VCAQILKKNCALFEILCQSTFENLFFGFLPATTINQLRFTFEFFTSQLCSTIDKLEHNEQSKKSPPKPHQIKKLQSQTCAFNFNEITNRKGEKSKNKSAEKLPSVEAKEQQHKIENSCDKGAFPVNNPQGEAFRVYSI
jgi:hypothetical protein